MSAPQNLRQEKKDIYAEEARTGIRQLSRRRAFNRELRARSSKTLSAGGILDDKWTNIVYFLSYLDYVPLNVLGYVLWAADLLTDKIIKPHLDDNYEQIITESKNALIENLNLQLDTEALVQLDTEAPVQLDTEALAQALAQVQDKPVPKIMEDYKNCIVPDNCTGLGLPKRTPPHHCKEKPAYMHVVKAVMKKLLGDNKELVKAWNTLYCTQIDSLKQKKQAKHRIKLEEAFYSINVKKALDSAEEEEEEEGGETTHSSLYKKAVGAVLVMLLIYGSIQHPKSLKDAWSTALQLWDAAQGSTALKFWNVHGAPLNALRNYIYQLSYFVGAVRQKAGSQVVNFTDKERRQIDEKIDEYWNQVQHVITLEQVEKEIQDNTTNFTQDIRRQLSKISSQLNPTSNPNPTLNLFQDWFR